MSMDEDEAPAASPRQGGAGEAPDDADHADATSVNVHGTDTEAGDDGMTDVHSESKREDATGEEQETTDDVKTEGGGAPEEEEAKSAEKDAMEEDHDGAGAQEAESKEGDDNDDKEDQDEDDVARSEGAGDAKGDEGDGKGDDEGEQDGEEQDGEEQDDADKSALEQEDEEEDEDGDSMDASKKEDTTDKSSRNDPVESDGEGEEEGDGDGEEEGKDADKDNDEKDEMDEDTGDAGPDSEGGAKVKKEDTVAGGVSKSAEQPGEVEEAGDAQMKDVKDEREGGAGEGEDDEDAASSGKKVGASKKGDADAGMSTSKTNGLRVDTAMDEDEAMGDEDKEWEKEAAESAVSEHQAGALGLAAANRAPSPPGSKDAISESKAQLAAKLRSRPQLAQVQIGNMVVKRLGNIVHDRPAYHTRRFIYPVGFLSERTYASYRQPGTKTVYVCEVLDGGRAPEFKITVSDDMDNPIVAADPTAAWRVVEQRVQAVPPSPADSRPQAVQRLCGAAYFGLAHPSVIKRLQELVGAKKCLEFPYDKKYQQLHEIVSEEEKSSVQAPAPQVSPTQPAPVANKNSSGSGAARGEASSVGSSRVSTTDPDLTGEWLPLMEKELGMIKERTNATIQPLSKSQLLPDGWSPQEVDTFFNGLNEHQMQVQALAAAIGSKTAQQVSDYSQYVCEVMDRRVKASREEQLQKHAAALQAAMQAAGHASSAQDTGAVALQAAMAAAASVPKEGIQLKEMLKLQPSHGTLAHVLTHLWHTERLWRHALHQGLQLFQETHQLSDRMMEKLHNMRNKLVKLSGQKVGGGAGGGGVSDSMLKKRLEEESKKIRAEFSEKTKKMIEQEKQIKKLGSDYKKAQEDFAAKHADHARACQDLRDLEVSRDQALSQMAECRGQMLKEQKARHALMLRKERLEAEVIRLRGLQAGEAGSRQAQEAIARKALGRNRELEEELQQQRSKVEALEQQLLGLGHAPCTEQHAQQGGASSSSSGAARQDDGDRDQAHGAKSNGRPGSIPRIPKIKGGGGARAEAESAAAAASIAAAHAPRESVIGKLARISVPTLKRRADGSWGEGEDGGGKRQRAGGGAGGAA